MAKIFGVNTKISGKVGQLLYRQTKIGTVVSELPTKPSTPLRTRLQMNIRTQWANLGAVYKLFAGRLRKGFENLPKGQTVYNAFIQANLGVVKVYISRLIRLNGGAVLAPYQITRGSLPSIVISTDGSNKAVTSLSLNNLSIGNTTTVGQFSQAIIANNPGYEQGDQLTFFHGVQTVDAVTSTPRATMTSSKLVLDVNSTDVLLNMVDSFGFATVGGHLGTSAALANGAVAWVHSRERENTLRVSTQYLYVVNSQLASYQGDSANLASIDSYGGVNSAAVYLQPDGETASVNTNSGSGSSNGNGGDGGGGDDNDGNQE